MHFVLELEQPWFQEDRPLIEKGEHMWEDLLPGKQEGQGLVIQIGPQAQGQEVDDSKAPMTPLAYRAVERDGSREWELAFHGHHLRVTCGTYSRWRQVWGIARGLFEKVGKVLNDRETEVRAVELTYQDLFIWEGDESRYDVGKLLTNDHGIIGGWLLKHGPLWHCHRGWIQEQNEWKDEAYLERIHLNGKRRLLRQEERPAVEMITTTRLGHGGTKSLFMLQHGFTELQEAGKKKEEGCMRFEWLHDKSIEMIGKVLTKEVQAEIGLRASQAG